ncbi:MAG: DUF4956 domain-containing protein [Clostridia bacterium]|nr:DUF4956 domain-containing protein [Clostridia bacterium]
MNTMFESIFPTATTSTISVADFLICVGASLVLGVLITLCYMFRARYTKSFVVTLATLPAVVCVVIMMVNGNIGAGVAVAGAFSLVRFRSLPGTAKDIGMLFLAMGVGLIAGMGYIGYAALFTVVLCAVHLLYTLLRFGGEKKMRCYKSFRITIPEDLDYTGVFEEIFARYTSSCELVQVKTTNMGSMFRLTYDVVLRDPTKEKELIDQLRCRNGNLEINVCKQASGETQL